MNKALIKLAAAAGIDARGMTLQQLKAAHDMHLASTRFVDQHDMRLAEALSNSLTNKVG